MINIEAIKERDRKLLEGAKQKDYDYIHECFKLAYQKVLGCLESGKYRNSNGYYGIPFGVLLPEDFEESLGSLGKYTAKNLLVDILKLNLGVLSISIVDYPYSSWYCDYGYDYLTITFDEESDMITRAVNCDDMVEDYYKTSRLVSKVVIDDSGWLDFIEYEWVSDLQIGDSSKEDDFTAWLRKEVNSQNKKETLTTDPESTPDEPAKELTVSDNLCKVALLWGLSGTLLGTLIVYIF